MANVNVLRVLANIRILRNLSLVPCRCSNTLPNITVEKHRRSTLSHTQEREELTPQQQAPRDFKYVYPEFLPDPQWKRRDRLAEKLERRDMLRRRAVIDIPEFYTGSILAVTVSDPHAPGKKNRFVGICIQRAKHGLRANFTLRNVVDGQGIEIMYELYNPTLQKIEVLKLEKRLDEELFYLRDAPSEHSTVPFDMEPVPHPPGMPVSVNQIKVKLGQRPWHERWERHDLQGVQDLGLEQRFYDRAKEVAKPWERYDLMKQHRETIHDDEAELIMADVFGEVQKIDEMKRRRKRGLPPVTGKH